MRLTSFFLRILFFSLIAFPVLADESEYFPLPEAASQSQVISTQDDLPLLPVPEQKSVPSVEPSDAIPSDDSTVCTPSHYWMVSSRKSVQSIHFRGRGPWGLQAQQIFPGERVCQSDLPTMSSQLVPGVPVCIFVHGSFVELPNQYVEAAGLYARLQPARCTPLQMIFYTWPSDGPYSGIFPIDVAVRGRQADFNGFHLAYLLSQIPASCPVCLIGHSHGSRVILSAMHLAGGGRIEGYAFPYSIGANRRIRVILAAGAMDHNWMNPGRRYDRSLNPIECLLNLRNRHDFALFAYPISRPFAHRAIARSGITQRDARKLGCNAAKLRNYDVSNLVGKHHLWPYYYQRPEIIAAMVPYIYFD